MALSKHTRKGTTQMQRLFSFFVSTEITQSELYPKLSGNRGHGFVNIISAYVRKGGTTKLECDTVETEENNQLMAE